MTGGAAALVAAARMLPVALIAPGLGGLGWSVGVRLLVGGGLVALAWPLVAAATPAAPLVLLVFRELVVGVALGVVAAVPFRAAEAAGLLVGRAAFLDEPVGPPAGRILGDGFLILALAVFAALDGPRFVVAGLVESYRGVALGAAAAGPGLLSLAVAQGAALVTAAALLAAPALVALLFAALLWTAAVRLQPGVARALGWGSARAWLLVGALLVGSAALVRESGAATRQLGEALPAAVRLLGGAW